MWASLFAATVTLTMNASFLSLWTSGRIAWDFVNDFGMALIVVLTSIAHCHTCFLGTMKDLKGLGLVYFIEGAVFCILTCLLVPRFGVTAMILCASISSLLCSVRYSSLRVSRFFGLRASEISYDWVFRPMIRLFPASIGAVLVAVLTHSLPKFVQLLITGGTAIIFLTCSLYFFAEPKTLRKELIMRVKQKFQSRNDDHSAPIGHAS
jgi:hypothetical protein